jgi:hypothetical protein
MDEDEFIEIVRTMRRDRARDQSDAIAALVACLADQASFDDLLTAVESLVQEIVFKMP